MLRPSHTLFPPSFSSFTPSLHLHVSIFNLPITPLPHPPSALMTLQVGGKRARLLSPCSSSSFPSTSTSSSPTPAQSSLPFSGHGSLMSPQPHASEPWLRDPMTVFSEELALHIFEDLTPADLGKCACVSKLWHRLVNDQMVSYFLVSIELSAAA